MVSRWNRKLKDFSFNTFFVSCRARKNILLARSIINSDFITIVFLPSRKNKILSEILKLIYNSILQKKKMFRNYTFDKVRG